MYDNEQEKGTVMASVSPKKNKGPIMPKVGRTVEGLEYLTTHTCPACMAVMETRGPGHPQLVCSRCTMLMRAKPKKIGN